MKILLPIIIMFLFFSCREKDKNTLVVPPKDITPIVQKSFKIVCDTVPAFFLNTEDGTLTEGSEVICDTIYDN